MSIFATMEEAKAAPLPEGTKRVHVYTVTDASGTVYIPATSQKNAREIYAGARIQKLETSAKPAAPKKEKPAPVDYSELDAE